MADHALRSIGGPRGRHGAYPWPQARLAALAGALGLGSCLMLLAGLAQKAYCLRFGWGAPQVYWKACYSDLPSAALREGLRGVPYAAGGSMTEPLGTGLVMRAVATVAPADGLARQQVFFGAWAVLTAVLLVLTVAATVWTCRRRPEWAAHVAFSPLLITVALVSADIVGVATTSFAVWAWSRSRPTAAGVLFGLAVVSRTYPLLVVAMLGVLAVRAGVGRVWARTAGTALITAVVAWGAGALFLGPGVLGPYQTWAAVTAQLGSPWYLATLAQRPVPMGLLTVMAVLGWVLALAAASAVALVASVRPRIGEVALVAVVVVLVTGKALPVQASLWLVPLVALAGLKWRDHLIWAATEVLAFVAVWLYLGGIDQPAATFPAPWYAVFLVLRLLGLCWLGVVAARQALARRDVGEEADDAAGPMSGRADAVVVRLDH